MSVVADYTFLDAFWTMLVFFAWVIWFWILITILSDVFRRRDIGGGKKTLWTIFVLAVPFVGVLLYLLVEHDGMAERSEKQMRSQQAQADQYIRSVAGGGGAASEIEKAKALLDSGAITQAEFDAIKAKALG